MNNVFFKYVWLIIKTDKLINGKKANAANIGNHAVTPDEQYNKGSSSGIRNLFDSFNEADETFQFEEEYFEESK